MTGTVTSAIGDYGLYAVFLLMLVSAVFPAASELVMLYAGAVASGAFASTHVTAFGHPIETAVWAYLAVTLTGIVANMIGAAVGWAVGSLGGWQLVLAHSRRPALRRRRHRRDRNRDRRRVADFEKALIYTGPRCRSLSLTSGRSTSA